MADCIDWGPVTPPVAPADRISVCGLFGYVLATLKLL